MRRIRLTLVTLFFAGGTLALAAFVFYSVEDWRGARAWASLRRQLEARGESFDAAKSIPAPIPDDQNLAMAPLFARALRDRIDPRDGAYTFGPPDSDNELSREIAAMPEGPDLRGNPRPSRTGSWDLGRRRDLARWQAYYRGRSDFPHSAEPQSPAADVLLALTRYSPLLDELAREAAARPLTRFPVAWKRNPLGITLPHLNVLQILTKTLSLRAIAELNDGRPADALADLELCFRLQEGVAAEPALISALVEITQLTIMLQPIWEGLADRRWTPEQLDRLSVLLQRVDVLSDFAGAIRGERNIMMLGTLDYFRNHRRVGRFLSDAYHHPGPFWSSLGPGTLLPLAPGGWYDQNKASGARYYQETILDAMQPAAHRVDLGRAESREAAFAREPSRIYNFFTKLSIAGSMLGRVARSQANVDCALAACALERYWGEHQAYPETLDALAPAFIPRAPVDLIDGASLRYRRTPDGRYQLYSIGGNEQDDGGVAVPNSTGSSADPEKGDWVWRYDAVQAVEK